MPALRHISECVCQTISIACAKLTIPSLEDNKIGKFSNSYEYESRTQCFTHGPDRTPNDADFAEFAHSGFGVLMQIRKRKVNMYNRLAQVESVCWREFSLSALKLSMVDAFKASFVNHFPSSTPAVDFGFVLCPCFVRFYSISNSKFKLLQHHHRAQTVWKCDAQETLNNGQKFVESQKFILASRMLRSLFECIQSTMLLSSVHFHYKIQTFILYRHKRRVLYRYFIGSGSCEIPFISFIFASVLLKVFSTRAYAYIFRLVVSF